MNFTAEKSIYGFMLLLWLIMSVHAENNNLQKGNLLLEQIDRKFMPLSYESYRKIINIEPDGRKKEFVVYTVKRGADKLAMLYVSPSIDKDKAILRLGDNMWLYVPAVGKPIRITSLQSVVGGVFNNADILLLDYHVEYAVAALHETNDEYFLELKAKTATVAYDKLKMWVKKDALILEKIECYSASGMLIKTLEYKNVKDLGGSFVRPSVIETTSPLYKDYQSFMITIKVKEKIFPDETFSLNYLPRLKDLK